MSTPGVREQPQAMGRALEAPRPGATTPRGFLRQKSLRRPPPLFPTLRIPRACVSPRPIVPRQAHAPLRNAMTRPLRPATDTSAIEPTRPASILERAPRPCPSSRRTPLSIGHRKEGLAAPRRCAMGKAPFKDSRSRMTSCLEEPSPGARSPKDAHRAPAMGGSFRLPLDRAPLARWGVWIN